LAISPLPLRLLRSRIQLTTGASRDGAWFTGYREAIRFAGPAPHRFPWRSQRTSEWIANLRRPVPIARTYPGYLRTKSTSAPARGLGLARPCSHFSWVRSLIR